MRQLAWILLAAGALVGPASGAADDDAASRAGERGAMVRTVAAEMALTRSETGVPALSPRVARALQTVPRHLMVPPGQRPYAYENRPLPIGWGQTISQPFIVGLMTEVLEPDPDDVVLEIGTGSGYQAAVLAQLVDTVYTIEIVPALGERAAERLRTLGCANVVTRTGDGYHGWEEHAPFDAIVVTAAASHIPPPLVRQLAPGGVMVLPVGGPFTVQQLTVVRKSEAGEVTTRQILPVAFVPLTGEH